VKAGDVLARALRLGILEVDVAVQPPVGQLRQRGVAQLDRGAAGQGHEKTQQAHNLRDRREVAE